MPHAARTFSAVVALTMLHHVPSAARQDRLFAEVHRVLRPGGIFVGADSMPSLLMRLFDIRDTMACVDPTSLHSRLKAVGFQNQGTEVGRRRFRFSARRRNS